MAISILPPAPAPAATVHESPTDQDSSSDEDIDIEGDARASKRVKISTKGIVTPGETITEDPQWMR